MTICSLELVQFILVYVGYTLKIKKLYCNIFQPCFEQCKNIGITYGNEKH